MTVSWESSADPVTSYVIYYQTKGGPVISDMVSGGETETHSLDGLQRGVTYYISILALSQHLPSPLVGPVTVVGESFPSPSSHHVLLSLDPLLLVETSPESLTTSPNTQFSLNCTARAMVDGETVPLNLDIEWLRIDMFLDMLSSTLYNKTEDPERSSGSILTSTEDGTVNNTIYRCTVSPPDGPLAFSDIIIFIQSSEDIMKPTPTSNMTVNTTSATIGDNSSIRGKIQLYNNYAKSFILPTENFPPVSVSNTSISSPPEDDDSTENGKIQPCI